MFGVLLSFFTFRNGFLISLYYSSVKIYIGNICPRFADRCSRIPLHVQSLRHNPGLRCASVHINQILLVRGSQGRSGVTGLRCYLLLREGPLLWRCHGRHKMHHQCRWVPWTIPYLVWVRLIEVDIYTREHIGLLIGLVNEYSANNLSTPAILNCSAYLVVGINCIS